jgi:hypothetical protein
MIQGSNLLRNETLPYWTANHQLKGNTSPQRRPEYNTYKNNNKILIVVHQILGLHYPKRYSTKDFQFARNSIGRTAAKETSADTNMFASYAALGPMENPLATDSNRIKQCIHNPHHQKLLPMLRNTSSTRILPSNTAPPPKYPTFRSYNNNIVWVNNNNINNSNNNIPNSTHDPSSFTTPEYQWKASRDLTLLGPPENHSITISLSAQPPIDRPFTLQETQIIEKLDPAIFNPISIIDIRKFAHYTEKHPNRLLITYLLNGLQFGFRLGYTAERKQSIMDNLTSLELSPTTLPTFIRNEMIVGRISGSFSLLHPPSDLFMVNPLGLVEKRDTNPTEYRVITHHSAPHGDSVNDGIDRHEFKISFDTLKHAARWIRHFGKGALLSKIDIKDAYRILSVHPVNQLLQ